MNNYYDYYNNMKKSNIDNDPYTAFIRGNLFNNLYDPYKNYIPAELNPTNEREYDLLLVQIYAFVSHELTLYLDTNPNDSNAIKLRSEYVNMYKQALAQYESKYGAFTLSSENLSITPWAWDTKYWPWEGNV